MEITRQVPDRETALRVYSYCEKCIETLQLQERHKREIELEEWEALPFYKKWFTAKPGTGLGYSFYSFWNHPAENYHKIADLMLSVIKCLDNPGTNQIALPTMTLTDGESDWYDTYEKESRTK